MALGRVQVNNLNLSQGEFPEVERKFLFIGHSLTEVGQVVALDSSSDLDKIYGADASDLKKQLTAAQLNAKQNWVAYAVAIDDDADIEKAILTALKTVSPEAVAICSPATTTAQISAYHDLAMRILGSWERQVFIMLALPGINAITQTWSDYEAHTAALLSTIAAPRVLPVPQLHGNNLGVLAGRLCNRATSIADSPMRVRTEAVLGLGATPKDKDGVELSRANLVTLDSLRCSVPQTYPDYPGVYWADGNLLEVPAGDYQVIEYLRPVLKAARAIRLLAISKIADRSFNNSPQSIEMHKTFFLRPLREMSKSIEFAGNVFPGEIKAPSDDAIAFLWHTKTRVEFWVKVCPYECPKDITANIIIDLTLQEQAA